MLITIKQNELHVALQMFLQSLMKNEVNVNNLSIEGTRSAEGITAIIDFDIRDFSENVPELQPNPKVTRRTPKEEQEHQANNQSQDTATQLVNNSNTLSTEETLVYADILELLLSNSNNRNDESIKSLYEQASKELQTELEANIHFANWLANQNSIANGVTKEAVLAHAVKTTQPEGDAHKQIDLLDETAQMANLISSRSESEVTDTVVASNQNGTQVKPENINVGDDDKPPFDIAENTNHTTKPLFARPNTTKQLFNSK